MNPKQKNRNRKQVQTTKAVYESKYDALDRFTNNIHNTKTEKTYLYNLQQFLNYAGFTPEQMLRIPQNSKDPMQNECFTIVQNYVQYLVKKKGLAPLTVNTFIAAIKLFFESNGVMLPFWTIISKQKGKRETIVIDRVYSTEEVKALLDHAGGLRNRVIILILLSTGMRVGALAGLKRKDIEYLPDYRIYKFIPYSDSKSSRYITFCTPECAKELDKYLRHGEEKEGERITDNSPVITHEITSSHRIKGKGFLSSQSIQQVLDRLRNEANVISSTKLTPAEIENKKFGKIRKEVMRAHGFRKIFFNACIDNDVNHTVKEALMGHKEGMGLAVNYWRPENQKKLLQEYLKVIEQLTISEGPKLTRQVQQLQEENQEKYELINNKLREKDRQIQKLTSKIETVKDDLMGRTRNLLMHMASIIGPEAYKYANKYVDYYLPEDMPTQAEYEKFTEQEKEEWISKVVQRNVALKKMGDKLIKRTPTKINKRERLKKRKK